MDTVTKAIRSVIARHDDFVAREGPISGYANRAHEALESYDNVARTTLKYLARGSTILDFGAGSCMKAAVLAEVGFRVYALDDYGDPWHKEDPQRPERIKHFARESGVEVVSSIEAAGGLDMVMVHDVLEHLHHSPRHLLERLIDKMSREGYLFVTVPNAANVRKRLAIVVGRSNLAPFKDYYWHPGDEWRGHVREYVRSDLRALAAFLHLEVQELRSCHHMLYKIPAAGRPLFRAFTVLFPGWRDTWLLVGRKRATSH